MLSYFASRTGPGAAPAGAGVEQLRLHGGVPRPLEREELVQPVARSPPSVRDERLEPLIRPRFSRRRRGSGASWPGSDRRRSRPPRNPPAPCAGASGHEAASLVVELVRFACTGRSRRSASHGMTMSAARLSMTNANSSRVAHAGAGCMERGSSSIIRGRWRDMARGTRRAASTTEPVSVRNRARGRSPSSSTTPSECALHRRSRSGSAPCSLSRTRSRGRHHGRPGARVCASR